MSLPGPPMSGPPLHESIAPLSLPHPLELRLAEVLSCLPVLKAFSESKEPFSAVAELMDAIEGLAVWLMEERRPHDAVRAFEVATRLQPQDNRLRKSLAVALTAAGAHQEALVAWQKICDRFPHDAENQLMLAQALYLSGDVSAGCQAFQDWLSRWSDSENLPQGLLLSARQWHLWLKPTSAASART